MLVFTSVTKSYIPKARVLAKSLKRFHPDWQFQLVLSDDLPANFDLSQEPFDGVVTLDRLGIPGWQSWAFGHTVVELCTAVKGVAAQLFSTYPGIDKLMYLDPDIKVFNALTPLEDLLDDHDVLLTPHLLDREELAQAVSDNEISALKHGVYNLGFFAAKTSGQGLEFVDWWAKRLLDHCIDDIPGGLFTDQRWCDLAPCFFDRLHIVRDRGCNVATWNIAHRPISKDAEGVWHAGGQPLRFYHFTGYDSGDGLGMLRRYAADQPTAQALWEGYGADLKAAGHGLPQYRGWSYGQFEGGVAIPLAARRLYRFRDDLQKAFPNPYGVDGGGYWAWYQSESRVARAVYSAGWQSLRKILRPFVQAVRRIWQMNGHR